MPKQLDAESRARIVPSQLAPRHSMALLAEEIGADIQAPAQQQSGFTDRLRAKILQSPDQWAFAAAFASELKVGDTVFCTSEHPGFHVAAFAGRRPGGPLVSIFVHNVNRPRARAALRLWRLSKKVHRFIACSRSQVDFLKNYLNLSEDRVRFIWDHTDTTFFRPGEPSADKQRAKIVSVGLEKRDYRTLALASQDLDADVCISGFSKDSTPDPRAFPAVLPANMSRRFYDWPSLSQLYRDADVVVVSAFENDYAAGVQGLMEGMASGRPVVVTETRGLKAYIDAGAVIPVRPGDANQMREAIQHVMKNPAEAAAMGRAARELALRRHSMEGYVAGLRELIK